MLKLKDLQEFRRFLESGEWADAFQYALEDLRLEMLGLVEELLDTADAADKVVGQTLFSKEGVAAAQGSTPLGEDK